MVQLEKQLTKEEFKDFICLSFSESTHFTLTDNYFISQFNCDIPEGVKVYEDLKQCLEHLKYGSFSTDNWHGYPSKNHPLDIFVYEFSDDVPKIFIELYENIFLEKEGCDSTLFDLCIFRGNLLMMGTISHARVCNYYPDTLLQENQMINTDKWIEGIIYDPEKYRTKLDLSLIE